VEGPGSLPSSWLEGELPASLGNVEDPRRLQFTGFEGDYFVPQIHFLVLNGQRTLGEGTRLQANTFFRSNEFTQFNDNITEPNARGETDIASLGGTLQLELLRPSGTTWTGGIEYARNDVEIFIFEVTNAAFPDAGGMTENVETVEHNLGIFAHVWWPATDRFSVTGSVRYDHVDLPFIDLLDPENSGENFFNQVTGSLGVDVVLSRALRGFAGYGRGFRAPVILELSCADPLDPCPLPFELVGQLAQFRP
jgi:outer membrane receptor protein involved in Fe transport